MMPVLAIALAYGGFACLALAMGRHFEQVFGRDEPSARQRTGLRLGGTTLLLLSILPCLAYWPGTSLALGVWSALISLAGLALVLLLPYAPRWAAGLGAAAPLLAGVAAAIA